MSNRSILAETPRAPFDSLQHAERDVCFDAVRGRYRGQLDALGDAARVWFDRSLSSRAAAVGRAGRLQGARVLYDLAADQKYLRCVGPTPCWTQASKLCGLFRNSEPPK